MAKKHDKRQLICHYCKKDVTTHTPDGHWVTIDEGAMWVVCGDGCPKADGRKIAYYATPYWQRKRN